MNEVRVSVNTGPVVAGSASSKGAVKAQPEISGNKLPESTEIKETEPSPRQEAAGPKDLETAVASMNDYVQSIQRDLQFSVDEDLEKTVVKVVDSHSGELIRQIPDAVFLELARKLREDGELQLVNALG